MLTPRKCPQIDYELAMACGDLPTLQVAAREYLPLLSPVADRDTWAQVAGIVKLLEVAGS